MARATAPRITASSPSAAATARHFETFLKIERRYILKVVADCAGNKFRAAKLLGVDNKTLYNKLRRYGSEAGRPGPRSADDDIPGS